MRNAEYRCVMGIGLGSCVRVRVTTRAWVSVGVRVVFCSRIV